MSATSEPGADHHAGDHGRVEVGDGRERRDGDEEEDLEQEPRHREAARARRVDGSDPRGLSRTTGAPLVPAGRSPFAGREGARLVPQRLHLRLQPADLRCERRTAPSSSSLLLRGRRVGDLRRLGRVRHRSPAQPSSEGVIASSAARLARAPRRAAPRATPSVARPARPPRRRATRRACCRSSSAGSAAGVRGGRRRRLQPRPGRAACASAERGDAERDERDPDELAHGGDGTAAVGRAACYPSAASCLAARRRSRRRLPVRPTQTEGRRQGTVIDYEILLMLDPELAEERQARSSRARAS